MQVTISHLDRMKFLSNIDIKRMLYQRGLDINKPIKVQERFDTLDLIIEGEPINTTSIPDKKD